MKLFIKPGACSLSPHIVLREAGLPVETVNVDLVSKKMADGGDFLAVNFKGQVPTLQLDDGTVLTEGAVIAQYVADQAPEKGLIPPAGSLDRYRVQEWLNFIGSELHKSFSPLFRPTTPDAYKDIAKQILAAKLAIVDKALAGKQYLTGDSFCVADAYLFTVTRWTKAVGIDLAAYPNVAAFMERVAARPAVQETLAAEGLA